MDDTDVVMPVMDDTDAVYGRYRCRLWMIQMPFMDDKK